MTYSNKAAYSEYIIQTWGGLGFFFVGGFFCLFCFVGFFWGGGVGGDRNPVEVKHVGQSFKLHI